MNMLDIQPPRGFTVLAEMIEGKYYDLKNDWYILSQDNHKALQQYLSGDYWPLSEPITVLGRNVYIDVSTLTH